MLILLSFLLFVFGLYVPSAYANDTEELPVESAVDNSEVDIFYSNWVDAQRSNIPTLKKWLETNLNSESEIVVKVTAQIPSLLDYKFHKTLKVNAKKAEHHLVQWLNIHKHSELSYDVVAAEVEGDIIQTEVHYKAQGVTVLPNGRHRTVRMKTELDVTCLDTLGTAPLNVIKSNCSLNATSIPLRSVK